MDLALLKLQYDSLGYAHLPGVLPPEVVERLRAAFAAATARYDPIWKDEIARGRADARYCDIPNILDCDDVFVDIVDLPDIVPILLALVGPTVQLNHTHARLFPPGKTYTAPWHSDLATVEGIDLAHSPSFFMKIHYFFEDLRPDQGCLAFIPGSHRFPPTLPRPKIPSPETSPLVVKVVPRAGDIVLFNTHVLHMALDNDSPVVRKSLIYAYSHFWVKHYANAVPADLGRLATTRLRRQLFGIEEEGVSYFDQRYDQNAGGEPTS
ncbi:MAG: phytanoyl-CoA dioxygenase family protein, partial [Gemmataceae bacterium]|nr:phytanoyl-CoA dioxygenase family protein [Gemmataceae bacterium]